MSERSQVSSIAPSRDNQRVWEKFPTFCLKTFSGIFWSGEKVLFIPFRKYITSHDLWTLCNGPETPTEWKSESVTYWPTNLPTYWPELRMHLKLWSPFRPDLAKSSWKHLCVTIFAKFLPRKGVAPYGRCAPIMPIFHHILCQISPGADIVHYQKKKIGNGNYYVQLKIHCCFDVLM